MNRIEGISNPPEWPPLWRRVLLCFHHPRRWRQVLRVSAAAAEIYNQGLNADVGGKLIQMSNQLWAELYAQPAPWTERALRCLGLVVRMCWRVLAVSCCTFQLVLVTVAQSLLFWLIAPFVIAFLVAANGLRYLPQYIRDVLADYGELMQENWSHLVFVIRHF